MSEDQSIIEVMNAAADQAARTRKKYVDALRYGKIPFHEFVTLLDDPDLNKTLGKMKIFAILATFAGWNRVTARHALISNGLPVELSLRQCRANENYMSVCTMLMNASASRWQQRVKAPEGWPWFGNVLDALNELDAESLPRDMRQYRYQVEGWVEGGETPAQVEQRWDSAREQWRQAPRTPEGQWAPGESGGAPGHASWDRADDLDDLLGDDGPDDDESSDGLDAVFADDGEEVPEEDSEEFDINSYLGGD